MLKMNADAFFEMVENFLCLQWALMQVFMPFNYMWALILWEKAMLIRFDDLMFVLIFIS